MRRLLTFVVVAMSTAVLLTHWLNDGDVIGAVQPVVAEWDAELLARNAGVLPAEEPAGIDAPADATPAADPARMP